MEEGLELVGTQHPGNIGAAARAMKTMGLRRLALVAPRHFPHAEAAAMAASAGDVLEMPTGCKHTVYADTELKLIEVQIGEDLTVYDKIKHEL